MVAWSRLIRFVSDNGKSYFGDAVLSVGSTDCRLARSARVINGSPFAADCQLGAERPVTKLLSPLTANEVRTIRCLGLNYRKHAKESHMDEPKWPVLFYKPAAALNGPEDAIPVPPMAQAQGKVDYEVELVVVIGKECRNVLAKHALDYVAGYTVGNDVSQREWQFNGGAGQWNVSKMFDGWAPIGPAVVSRAVLEDPENLKISSTVNGEPRQSDYTSDMIFSVAQTIEFISHGSTLLPGDLIFMGTPAGVGMAFSPPKWITSGDTVECAIEGIGSIKNQYVWTRPHKL